MENPILQILNKRKKGIHVGIPSFCSSNKLVIETALEQAKRNNEYVLIEATSNQINQFGGYMNMSPKDFKEYVYKIADKLNFDKSKIMLGGDHLGPQPWQNLDENTAMEYSKELVKQFVLAGFIKIHLDTSMRLKDDNKNEPLLDETIAKRGAELYAVCEEAYQQLKKINKDAIHPVFVIGSEVPIPGGTQKEETLSVTKSKDFKNTIETYKEIFSQFGLDDAWNYIIAVVVQPGVEFGSSNLHLYNRLEAKSLTKSLTDYPDIVFEGHSTDFQPKFKLREMVEDGVAILKVGPALTFALREGLFALSMIEKELIPNESRSNFIETLENYMDSNPKYWEKYYTGTKNQINILKKYSFSDRCRYYLSDLEIEKTQEKLFKNFDNINIPLYILHQYMPVQYIKVRDGLLKCNAKSLVKDYIVNVIEDYNYAVK